MEGTRIRSFGCWFGAWFLLFATGPGAEAWIESVDVVPGSPSCDEQFTVSVEGAFGDGCWSVTGIDFVQDASGVGFVVHAVDAWNNNNCATVIVEYSATEVVGPLPEGTYSVYAIEDVSSLRVPEGDQLAETFEVCCSVSPDPITDLRIEKIVNGYQLRFTWTDVGGAEEYLLYEDSAPDGEFQDLVDIATSGTTGIDAPVLFLDGFFLLEPSAGCPADSLPRAWPAATLPRPR